MNFLQKILPWIGAAATGNVPALVTMAASTVGKVLGKDVKADPDSIAAAVSGATPDQILALKKEDDDFAYKMKALGFQTVEDLLKVDADDRANARSMQIQTKSWVAPSIATVFVVGFFVVMGLKIGHVFAFDQTLNDLITTLRDGLMLILAYYFGSSAGSQAKTQLLAQAPPVQGGSK